MPQQVDVEEPRRSRRLWLLASGIAVALILAIMIFSPDVFKERPRVINHGPRDRHEIALTFDADMTRAMAARLKSDQVRSGYDPAIVRQLQETGTPATFFVTGLWAMTYPDVVRLLAGDPLFEVENHSVDHAAFTANCYGLPAVPSESMKRWEVSRTAALLTSIAGVTPRYFRFPGGCYDRGDLQIVQSLGHEVVGWDVLSGDAFERDPAVIVKNVLEAIQPGAIIVMHVNGAPHAPATAAALETLIPALRTRGLRFVTVNNLLRGSSPSN